MLASIYFNVSASVNLGSVMGLHEELDSGFKSIDSSYTTLRHLNLVTSMHNYVMPIRVNAVTFVEKQFGYELKSKIK